MEKTSQMGTTEHFAKALRSARAVMNQSLDHWATAGKVSRKILSNAESAQGELLSRNTLITLTQKVKMPQDEADELLIDAGYIPILNFELTKNDQRLLKGAIRELLRSDAPTGYIQILKKRIIELDNLTDEDEFI